MFIDTHCHLDFKEFDPDREQVIKGFKDNGIDCIINPGSDLEASCRAAALAQKHESIYAGVGIHPHHAGEVNSDTLAELKNLAQANNKVVAIGEVGLDYFRNLAPRDIQQDVFRKFIDLAFVLDLPLIIHDRDAHDDILKILKEKAAELSQQPVESRRETADLRGVVHCFSGDEILAAEFLKLGFYISFTGNITFKKAEDLRKVVAVVPVERMLLETDAPFLTPQKFRGQRNEPRLIKYIAEEIARIKGLSIKDIARITSLNVKNLFSIELGKDNNKGLIAYPIRDSLYLNITNRCTNDCIFCIRGSTDFVKGHNLRLENEPDVDRIIEA
ncbi:MAG: YchF/TatD family DNA exonuclease, partial [Candidatus Omnitrophica bacterium]|nr:YchF/TatD family DNA exonuclease [Candidatus Omnitrophota bacterium]